MSQPLKWENLPKNKCPQCGKDTALKVPWTIEAPKTLESSPMMSHPCGFKISMNKYNEIINKIVNTNNTQNYDS